LDKFDPIDIFFIIVIGLYFITLFCIALALIYLRVKKRLKMPKVVDVKKEKELKLEKVIIKIKKGPKEAKKVYNMPKLSEIKIIRKLFMKEIKPQENEIKKKNIEKVILKPEKITINKVDNQVKTNNIRLFTTYIRRSIYISNGGFRIWI